MMKKELFRQIKYARNALALTIIFGVLGAIVMIAQMAFLSRIVSLVFLAHQDLAQVSSLLLLLVGTIGVHAGIVWVREVTALQGAIRVKSERLEAYVSRYVPQMALSVLVPLLIAAYILPLDWTSAVLLLVTGPVIPLLMILVGSYAEAQIQRQWIALSRM